MSALLLGWPPGRLASFQNDVRCAHKYNEVVYCRITEWTYFSTDLDSDPDSDYDMIKPDSKETSESELDCEIMIKF